MLIMWESLQFPQTGGDPPEDAHGGETVRLPPVPGQFFRLVQPEEAPEGPHRGETLQLPPV